MKKKIEEMSVQHQFAWNVLTTLEDGQRILGVDLQQRAAVRDMRTVYQIIKELRHNGYLVGGDKGGEKGYYEIRDEEDLERTLRGLREPAFDMLNTAKKMEQAFLEKRYGNLLNQEEVENNEERE